MGKGFKLNQDPMDYYMTEEPAKEKQPEKRAAKKSAGQQGKEIKNKRVQLVLRPSLFEEIKARAAAEDISVNELITRAVKEYLKEA